MNALEKALLIKELNILIDGLEHRSLSFFEIAKSKSRLTEIFGLCDEPIFKKQILKFKSHTQPEKAAYDFAANTLYKLSFRGVFLQDSLLEKALYQNADAGWAILYHAQKGWQIWLIPTPNRTALVSEWGYLENIYHWMLAQQQIYICLQTDHELKQHALLEHQRVKALTETDLNLLIDLLPKQNQTDIPDSLNQAIETLDSDQQIIAIDSKVQHDELHAALHPERPSICNDQSQETPVSATLTPQENKLAEKLPKNSVPQTLALKQYIAHIHPLDDANKPEQALYRLEIRDAPEISQHVDLLLYGPNVQHWQQLPIYLAEQINSQGHFIKYLVLLGTENQMQAIRLIHLFTDPYQHQPSAIKEIFWNHLQDSFTHLETLFDSYSQKATLIWNIDRYTPFIPVQLIQTQKFIQFEESPAHSKTPLLLLKERHKIRLIHGQKRLNLSRTESAYPYLLLDRHQGVSWQLIQTILTQLESPIDCHQLYEAIEKHLSD